MYARILQAGLDIKLRSYTCFLDANIALTTHPVESVEIFSGNQSGNQKPRKPDHPLGSRYPIGLNIHLQSGDASTLSKDSSWSILQLLNN